MWISIICPCCHSRMTMQCLHFTWAKEKWNWESYNYLSNEYHYNQIVENRQYLYKCWNKDCNSLIITTCRGSEDNQISIFPMKDMPFDFSSFPNLKVLSPDFVNIFNSAHIIDNKWYKEIAWPWYRKAMEFLIKDYIISTLSDDSEKDKVSKMHIMDCLEKYIDNEELKSLSEKTFWLGNDQVHYYQKWEDKDINYLKEMIITAMNYIEMKLRIDKISKDFS